MSRHSGKGTPRTEEGAYARRLGITLDKLRRLGGVAKLRTLSPDALKVLVAPNRYGYSRTVMKGGMKARGMKACKPGYLVTPHMEFGQPLECLVNDEDLASASVESLGEVDG